MAKSDRHQTDEATREYAPPACILHDVDPAYSGISFGEGLVSDIFAWRKALSIAQREDYARLIAAYLDQIVTDVAGKHVSLFWPFQGEPDLRGWMATLTARGVS